jgi:hypothetical protein
MENLKRIIEVIEAESSGVQAKLLVARVGLKIGVSLARINENTPDNPDLENRILKAAREILHKDISLSRKKGGK